MEKILYGYYDACAEIKIYVQGVHASIFAHVSCMYMPLCMYLLYMHFDFCTCITVDLDDGYLLDSICESE